MLSTTRCDTLNTMTTRDTIANTIKERVDAQAIPLSRIATALNIDKGGVWHRLRGSYSWRAEELVTVAHLLGVTSGDLLAPADREAANG